ncbi:RDD family protein [Acinetobacter guerrae]|uniref:RDD family protein n=1 Tax=Acinetobacter guerrae TaxID=1843371 RepID=A0A3A8F0K9_9GAMM|nr:RDD family protein [Acinetobacter guerrae]RKG35844.1 RDD family protein [Acinetobacter guerrae]
MQIYLARNNQQAGPYTLEQLNQMLASQQVLLTDLAWHEGMTEWRALGELTQGKLIYQPENLSTTGSVFDTPNNSHNDVIRDIKVNQTAKATAAPVSKRISAKLVDLALLTLPQIIVTMLFLPHDLLQQTTSFDVEQQIKIAEAMRDNMPTWIPVALLVYTLGLLFLQNFFIARSGQSIGKKIFHLQIVDATTYKLPGQFRGFFIRSFLFVILSQLISLLPLLVIIFIADIVLFFSKGNNSLHDRLAKTKVISLKK